MTANSIDEALQQQDKQPDAVLYIGKTTASHYIDTSLSVNCEWLVDM
jgi:hypothetical protein